MPVEIEIDCMLYNLIQSDILRHFDAGRGMPIQEWVNICFRERMEQIITDPKEWGKLLLNQSEGITAYQRLILGKKKNEQQIVLELLKELCGVATVSEISRLAREKYPDISLSHYVGDRLEIKKMGLCRL
jgi:hypothetical protein